MRRFTISTLALTLAAAPSAAAAQDSPGPDQHGMRAFHGARIAERLIERREELGLTTSQVAQIRRIQTWLEEQNRPLTEQLHAARKNLRQQHQQMTQEQRAQQRAERREQMTERREQMREHMQARRELRDSVRERAATLTPEQRQQLRADMHARMRERMPEEMRHPRARRLPEELQPIAEQIRQNRETAVKQIQETLTPEQREQVRQHLRAAGPRGAARPGPMRRGGRAR